MNDKVNKSISKGQTPGFQIDYNNFENQEAIQRFVNKQLWATGGTYNSDATQTITTTVKWGGQSRFLCGFGFICNNPNQHTLSITLNNEKMIDSVPMQFLFPSGGFGNIKFLQYFEFIRPLSGSDTFVISDTATVAEPVGFAIYMTRAYNKYYTRD